MFESFTIIRVPERKLVRWMHAVSLIAAFYLFAALTPSTLHAKPESIIVQSTTSTANSGLYEHLLPKFENETDIDVRVVAVGTGQAIRNATNCDADVLLVHAKAAEQQFIDNGYGDARHDLMYNDFVLVGPSNDPVGVRATNQITDALVAIAQKGLPFTSRGDDSGTHKKELALWSSSGVDPSTHSGGWYRETGSGMGSTLNIASSMNAYTLTDRATWISFKNKGTLTILFEDDEQLFNQYGIIAVSKQHCPNVKHDQATEFIEWLLGKEGQALIASYRLQGQQLFFPNAGKQP